MDAVRRSPTEPTGIVAGKRRRSTAEPFPSTVIIDASSAILLAKAGLMQACCDQFQVLMTHAVFEEVTVPRQAGAEAFRAMAYRRPGLIVIGEPDRLLACHVFSDLERLHSGERDTLTHYLNGKARFVIIDDGKGVQVCRRHRIPHVNALLLPAVLHHCGRLSAHQAHAYFQRIRRLGHYSAGVVAWAEQCSPADLDFFILE